MDRDLPHFGATRAGSARTAEWPSRSDSEAITREEIARTARELVAAYGPAAIQLMKRRTRAVRRRGDAESATLWLAVAEAIEDELSTGASGPSPRLSDSESASD